MKKLILNSTVEHKLIKRKREERFASLLFITGLMLLLVVFLGITYNYNHDKNSEIMDGAQKDEVELIETVIHNEIYAAISALLLTAESNLARETLLDKTEASNGVLAHLLSDVAETIGFYDQLRLIDHEGMEVLRVDYSKDEGAKIIPEALLQDKSSRYYFTETMLTPPDQVYMSALDLNIENGQVEEPYHPMLRISKRIDDKAGNPLGMAIVNVHAQDIIDNIVTLNIHEDDNIYLINNQGYYIVSPDANKNFAFMFEDKKDVGFFSDYPEIWEDITTGYQEFETDTGNFYIKETHLVNPNTETVVNDSIYVVMHVLPEHVKAADKELVISLGFAFGIFTLLISIIGWVIGKQWIQNKWYKRELIENATMDQLTGLFNRRFIYSQLRSAMKLSVRTESPLSVIYVDVNDLKKMNDEHGHEMGDQMLASAAKALENSARETDMVARIGGDEFLIVLRDCRLSDATLVKERTIKVFKKFGIMRNYPDWSMSYGIAEFDGQETMNELIMRADELMYQYKKQFKEDQK